VNVPASGTTNYTYNAVVYDQYGTPLPSEQVSWSLTGAGTGVQIASSTSNSVIISIGSSASSSTFSINAALIPIPPNTLNSQLTVTVKKVSQVADSTSSASTVNLSTPYRAKFTAIVKDANGNNITGLSLTDFCLSHISDSEFRTLAYIDGLSNYTISEFTDNNNGTYTWIVSRSSEKIRDGVEVQARNPAFSTSYVTIQTGLDNVRIG
jgi:hypothetical protein